MCTAVIIFAVSVAFWVIHRITPHSAMCLVLFSSKVVAIGVRHPGFSTSLRLVPDLVRDRRGVVQVSPSQVL